jgi:hypothetical protein
LGGAWAVGRRFLAETMVHGQMPAYMQASKLSMPASKQAYARIYYELG